MLKRVQIESPDDYFLDLGKRPNKGVYFCRINGYNQQIYDFVRRYYDAARLNGVIIEGKLQNPDNNNLAYYNEIMGMDFQADLDFINSSLQKWLPRMTGNQRDNVAGSIYDILLNLKQAGKNENMLKNVYIKFMCWLYYKFDRIIEHLGEEKLPKILYEGSISNYELLFMSVLSLAGCDIVLLQYQGDAAYLKVDPDSSRSEILQLPGLTDFPANFNLRQIEKEKQEALNTERLYGPKPQLVNCTNAWISGSILEAVKLNPASRGVEQGFFYNCFSRLRGVEDKLTYENELYQLQVELKKSQRRLVIVNKAIPSPTIQEINSIPRRNYKNIDQFILGLAGNIRYPDSQELQRIMIKAFVDLLLTEYKKADSNFNLMTSKAISLLCWLKRYQQQLFGKWKESDIACFFYMGACQNSVEALFCRFLARMPVDVLLFNPDLNQECCLADPLLYEVNNVNSLHIEKYPEDNTCFRMATAAYQAECELDSLMYQDSGIYRNQQYAKANSISLQTMYEEIAILWDQELKYRPNFNIIDGVVNIPVLFAKVSGVKDGDVSEYWSSIKSLITPDTLVIKKVPNLTSTTANDLKSFATEFLRNGKLQKNRIKGHKAYKYGFLRESVQDYLLAKLQLLLEQKLVKGTFENGTEYTVVSTVLNLKKDILRMIQKFDFTKKNPKLIYIITKETVLSLEDTICAAFLNLVGFDILFFVPTGYQCIEKFFNRSLVEEYQIGEYLYDLQIPDFSKISINSNVRDFLHNLFKRGT